MRTYSENTCLNRNLIQMKYKVYIIIPLNQQRLRAEANEPGFIIYKI